MGSHKKQKSTTATKSSEFIDHAKFLQLLTEEFPKVPQAFDECGKGLLHCEMALENDLLRVRHAQRSELH